MSEVRSDLAANVWKILVAPGTAVEEDETIMILESMKMEIPVDAPESGVVTDISVSEGEAVAEGQLLAVLD
ncbi:biotin/lipoyl-binding carrier protein [Arthrobacter sp. GCM10027362]|uniref:biotin/lipoyl-binding carrier protein n=1 Tax=Arthrobacter sp. GCM10027362 TaxID=3273379 RepID=UPI00362B4B3D